VVHGIYADTVKETFSEMAASPHYIACTRFALVGAKRDIRKFVDNNVVGSRSRTYHSGGVAILFFVSQGMKNFTAIVIKNYLWV